MSKKKTADKKTFSTYLIPGLILGVIIIAILSSFGIRMIEDAKDRVERGYQEEVKGICEIYEREIYAVDKMGTIAANYIYNFDELICDETVEYANSVAKALDLKNMYIINPNFSAIDINGKTYESINKRPFFSEVVQNKSGALRYFADENGKRALYVIKPVSSKSELKGYIVLEYVPKVMDTLLDNPIYSSRNSFALVSSDGYVVEIAGNDLSVKVDDNILEVAENVIYISGSYTSFSQAINDCRTGAIQTMYQEKGLYEYYAPIEGTKSMVLLFVDASDVERNFVAVSKGIRSMLLEIGITIIAFVAIFAGISLFNRAKYNIESEDLQNKADTDLLTDLYNKIATERMIKEYIAGEGKNSVSMLFVLDVDNFKKINDTMGHAFGDQVLSQLGHQIRAWFRVNDIVGRIGGDEFMIFIKDVKDPEVIKREGSRIMQFFEGFNVGEYTRYSPTASVGGAVYPSDAKDFESLYKAADKAVYKSKKEGKNRVSFYCDLNVIEKDAEVEKED